MAERRPRVFATKSSTCVFRPGSPMGLRAGRLAELVESNLATGTALVCHLTTYGQRPDMGEVLRRSFFDAHGDRVASVQVVRRLAVLAGKPDPFRGGAGAC